MQENTDKHTMKAVELESYGGPEKLHIREVPRPSVGPGEVLIKIKFASVNAVDVRVRHGYLKDFVKPPYIVGSDFSGIIEAAGEGVDLQPGTAVFGGLAPNTGSYAEYITFKATEVAEKPERLSFEEAAALSLAGHTAWLAVVEQGKVQVGQRILIHGASGGVGHIAVQLAKWLGAYVIGTASTDNLAFVRSIGADEAIDYHTLGFENQIRDIDLVVDGVSAKSAASAYAMMKPGALLISLFDPPPPAPQEIRAEGLWMRRLTMDTMVKLANMAVDKKLQVNISKVFSLEMAGIAQEYGKRGKVLIRI
jgi:NADPH:quinone reductase-like Zn-dependent oxidoreductase